MAKCTKCRENIVEIGYVRCKVCRKESEEIINSGIVEYIDETIDKKKYKKGASIMLSKQGNDILSVDVCKIIDDQLEKCNKEKIKHGKSKITQKSIVEMVNEYQQNIGVPIYLTRQTLGRYINKKRI